MASEVRELTKEMESLKKKLDTVNEILDKRRKVADERGKVLTLMCAELENKPSDSSLVERFEGFHTYIISYQLEDLIEEKNWLVGIILSASTLEDVGKRKLKRAFKGKIDPEKIDHLQFEQTIMFLLASGLVDTTVYHKLMAVRKARNKLAHDSFMAISTYLQTGLVESKNCQEHKSIIKKAIFCLKSIYPPVTH